MYNVEWWVECWVDEDECADPYVIRRSRGMSSEADHYLWRAEANPMSECLR